MAAARFMSFPLKTTSTSILATCIRLKPTRHHSLSTGFHSYLQDCCRSPGLRLGAFNQRRPPGLSTTSFGIGAWIVITFCWKSASALYAWHVA